jgi:hypothetical protein
LAFATFISTRKKAKQIKIARIDMNIKNDDFFAYFEFIKKKRKNTIEKSQQKVMAKFSFLTIITVWKVLSCKFSG